MYYYKAIIQYNGSEYCGFQFIPGLKTIQNEINQALSQLNLGKVTTNCASRTDTGVHAFHQIIKITSEKKIESSKIEFINKLLPTDICIIELNSSTWDFHPTKASISKEYRYLFTNKTIAPEEQKKLIANISNQLSFEIIESCLLRLKGIHNFQNFCSQGSNVKSTIREIYQCELSIINPHELFSSSTIFHLPPKVNQCYQLKIEANGFLKQMIRHIVSALWMVGSGKISEEQFLFYLENQKINKQLWKVAPPNGLYLSKINYKRN